MSEAKVKDRSTEERAGDSLLLLLLLIMLIILLSALALIFIPRWFAA
jgi:flagellar basal body-associated protein FliL